MTRGCARNISRHWVSSLEPARPGRGASDDRDWPRPRCRLRSGRDRLAPPRRRARHRATGTSCAPGSPPARAARSARRAPRPYSASATARPTGSSSARRPGAEEDRQGEPFVGRAGQLLNSMLRAIGSARRAGVHRQRAQVPAARQSGSERRPRAPSACPIWSARSRLLKPKIMLAVGRIAAQNLLRTEAPLARLRRQVHAFGRRAGAAGGHLSSGLSAALARRQAQGLGGSEICARGVRACPALSRSAHSPRSRSGRCTSSTSRRSSRSSAPPTSSPGARGYSATVCASATSAA